MYQGGAITLLSLDEYAALAVDCLEVLSPEMIIMRLMGDAPRATLVAPSWSLHKQAALRRITQELAQRQTYQGKLFQACQVKSCNGLRL
jgi:radical SAM superfamily enzyme